MKKMCTKCGEVKPIEQFSLMRGKPRSHCKKCSYESKKEWSKTNAEAIKIHRRTFYLNHTEQIKKAVAEYRSKNPEKERLRLIKILQKKRKILADGYVANCLARRKFTSDQITPELIAAYRAMIKLKRAVKEIDA